MLSFLSLDMTRVSCRPIAITNMMYAHLKQGIALPPSQLVRTVQRGGSLGAAPAITAANVPPVQGGACSCGSNYVFKQCGDRAGLIGLAGGAASEFWKNLDMFLNDGNQPATLQSWLHHQGAHCS